MRAPHHLAPDADIWARLFSLCVEDFVLGSGPGGQNVNKVASAVVLTMDARARYLFDDATWAQLRDLAGRRMRKDGAIVIQASRHRTQEANRHDARQRLMDLVIKAHAPPPPPRKPTKPTKASIARRLDNKARTGRTKAMRARPVSDD